MTTNNLRLDIKSWDEQPYEELPGGRTLKQAEVTLSGGGANASLEAVWRALLYYGPDGTSTYVGVMHAVGTLGGRSGGFVLVGQGTFDGRTARITSEIVPGSGTGELDGIRGHGVHASTHEDYPHWPLALSYELE